VGRFLKTDTNPSLTLSDPSGRVLALTDTHTAAKKGGFNLGGFCPGVWSVTSSITLV